MKNLSEILNNLSVIQVIGKPEFKEIEKISVDSRISDKRTIFVAITGFKVDAHQFLQDVINKGVAAVVVEKNNIPDEIFLQNDVVKILVEDSRTALAELSNSFYDFPSKRLKLFGITGTKGKSTTAIYLYEIFKRIESKAGLIGTIVNRIGEKIIPSKLTTPESYQLNDYFSEMISSQIKSCAVEVSSHSLELKRTYGLDFDIAGFTNLASDHLDYHKTKENYLKAKKTLFDNLKKSAFAVVNIDDESYSEIIKNSQADIFTYGKADKADFRIENVFTSLGGTEIQVKYKNIAYHLETKLIGDFNAYNATLAFAMAILANFKSDDVISAIKETPQIPGRFEILNKNHKTAIIDYAHTAGSLEAALKSLRKIIGEDKKIFTVFGAGGDRDKSKRPEMGRIAEKYSDKIFVTSDNPRTENREEIINDIFAGLNKTTYRNADREQAIKDAIELADENTVVIIEGKGHETYNEVNGVRTHFSDKEIAEKYL